MSSLTINPPLQYIDKKFLTSIQGKVDGSSEGVLFSIDAASGIGIISQLSEISRYTNQLLGNIVERTSTISSRISKLRQRILDIEEQYPEIEKKLSSTNDVSILFNEEIEPSVNTKQSNLSLQSLPRSEYIQSLYDKNRPDPDFGPIEQALGGDLNLMQYYSNLSFIKEPAKEKKKKEKKKSQPPIQRQSSVSTLNTSGKSSSNATLSRQNSVSFSSPNPLPNEENPFDINALSEDPMDDISFDDIFEEGDQKSKSKPKSSTVSETPSKSPSTTPTIAAGPPGDLLSAIRSFDRSKLKKNDSESTETAPVASGPPRPTGGMPADLFSQIRSFDRSKLRSVKNEEVQSNPSSSTTPALPSNPQQDILAAIKNFNRSNLKPVNRDEESRPSPTPATGQSAILSQILNFDRSKLNKVNIEEEREKRRQEAPVNPMNNMLKEIMAKRFALLNVQNASSSESEESEWSE